MWESNMALAFNFPDHNELQVEKQVDVSDVNPLFRDSFKNQKIFTFNIQNLATHYEAKATDEPAIQTEKLPDTAYSSAKGLLSYESSLPEDVGTGSAVLWSSDKSDPSSLYRDQRRGTLTWDSAINISPYSYLTFDVYVQGSPTDTCAMSNLYVELWDTSGKQMGSWQQGAAKQRCLRRGDRAAPGNVVHRTADVELPETSRGFRQNAAKKHNGGR